MESPPRGSSRRSRSRKRSRSRSGRKSRSRSRKRSRSRSKRRKNSGDDRSATKRHGGSRSRSRHRRSDSRDRNRRRSRSDEDKSKTEPAKRCDKYWNTFGCKVIKSRVGEIKFTLNKSAFENKMCLIFRKDLRDLLNKSDTAAAAKPDRSATSEAVSRRGRSRSEEAARRGTGRSRSHERRRSRSISPYRGPRRSTSRGRERKSGAGGRGFVDYDSQISGED